jgi:putative redox protein
MTTPGSPDDPAPALATPPPVTLELTWNGALRFAGQSDGVALTLDADRQAGPTPVQALAFALAGCMAADVVQILVKGRLPLAGLTTRLHGERRGEVPRYFTRITLHFVVTGAVPPEKVERAVALSREKYCTVWHSLRPDIALSTSFEIAGGAAGGRAAAPAPDRREVDR